MKISPFSQKIEKLRLAWKCRSRCKLPERMSAFVPEEEQRDETRRRRVPVSRLTSAENLLQSDLKPVGLKSRFRFEHCSLVCMGASNLAVLAYTMGMLSAHSELQLEIVALAIKTVFEVYFNKWGPDLLIHHCVMGGAFVLLQFPDFQHWAFLCVYMQLVHVPLFLKHLWTVAELDNQRLDAVQTKRVLAVLHSMFWPCWLVVVFFRTPFLLRMSAHAIHNRSPIAACLVFVFAACVMYLDVLWTSEVAMSKSHGVVGAAVTEPGGWPAGIRRVEMWALSPCFVGLSIAVVAPLGFFI